MKKLTFTDPNNAYQFSDENVKYNIRKMTLPRTNKDGLTKVIIEVCQYTYIGTGQYNTKFKRVSTDVWINTKDWNKKKELVNGKDEQAETKNKDIDRVFMAVKAYVNSKGQQTPEQAYIEKLSLEVLAEFFPSRQENRKTLLGYIEQYNMYRKNNGTIPNTLKRFITLKNRVEAFDKYRGKTSYIENIDITWSDAFNLYLSNTRNYNSGTIQKTFVAIRTCLNYYYDRRDEMQITITDKFRRKAFMHGTESINDAKPLSREQLETLYLHTFDEPYLNRIKDRFIWQCSTGLRFCNAFGITKEDIQNNWLIFKPSKTLIHNVRVEQPLNPIALEILKKYDFDLTKLKITNQVYNRELKTMFNKLNEAHPDLHYNPNSGSYASRDTFISQLVDAKVSVHNILKYTGQSSFSIMNRYVKTSSKLQQEEINTVFAIPKTTL